MTNEYPKGTLPTTKMREKALEIAERNAKRGHEEATEIFLRMAGATTRTVRKYTAIAKTNTNNNQQ